MGKVDVVYVEALGSQGLDCSREILGVPGHYQVRNEREAERLLELTVGVTFADMALPGEVHGPPKRVVSFAFVELAADMAPTILVGEIAGCIDRAS